MVNVLMTLFQPGVGTCGSLVPWGTGEPTGSARICQIRGTMGNRLGKRNGGTGGNREPGWGPEVGNRGDPRTMSGSQDGEPGGTKNRVGEQRRGTKGNRQ